jgi:hypothetical protein
VAAVARLPTYAKYGIVVALLVLVGVGAAVVGTQVRQDTGGPPVGNTRVTSTGRLVNAPALLSESAIAKSTKRGSPAEATLRFYYWVQWGSIPNVVHAYDPLVAARVSPGVIADAWDLQRVSLKATEPRIVRSDPGRRGTVTVTLQLLRQNADPQKEYFTLHRIRRQPGWYVVFDTMLYHTISSAVALSVPDYLSPGGSAKAQRVAATAAANYRRSALRTVREGG